MPARITFRCLLVTYELRVSAPNFGEYVRSGIELEVSQTARIDVRLQVSQRKGNR